MRNVMDLMEGDEGLRDRQGLDASMYVMGYIFKKKEKKWIGYAGAGAGGRQPKSKRNRGGGATVKWKQVCGRSKDLERGYETSEDQDIKMQ